MTCKANKPKLKRMLRGLLLLFVLLPRVRTYSFSIGAPLTIESLAIAQSDYCPRRPINSANAIESLRDGALSSQGQVHLGAIFFRRASSLPTCFEYFNDQGSGSDPGLSLAPGTITTGVEANTDNLVLGGKTFASTTLTYRNNLLTSLQTVSPALQGTLIMLIADPPSSYTYAYFEFGGYLECHPSCATCSAFTNTDCLKCPTHAPLLGSTVHSGDVFALQGSSTLLEMLVRLSVPVTALPAQQPRLQIATRAPILKTGASPEIQMGKESVREYATLAVRLPGARAQEPTSASSAPIRPGGLSTLEPALRIVAQALEEEPPATPPATHASVPLRTNVWSVGTPTPSFSTRPLARTPVLVSAAQTPAGETPQSAQAGWSPSTSPL